MDNNYQKRLDDIRRKQDRNLYFLLASFIIIIGILIYDHYELKHFDEPWITKGIIIDYSKAPKSTCYRVIFEYEINGISYRNSRTTMANRQQLEKILADSIPIYVKFEKSNPLKSEVLIVKDDYEESDVVRPDSAQYFSLQYENDEFE
jgi:hypothetical protein